MADEGIFDGLMRRNTVQRNSGKKRNPEAMIEQGAIVMYKQDSRKFYGSCGIVEGMVADQPDFVWVRWVGETASEKESVQNLETV
jgi:hypothetical protein